MTHTRSLILTATLRTGAAVALAQTPVAAPPAPPTPPTPAEQAATPRPAVAPRAPMALIGPDDIITPAIEAQIEAARVQLRDLSDFHIDREEIRAQVEAAREQIRAIEPQLAYATRLGNGFPFAPQITPMPPQPAMPGMTGRGGIRISTSPDRA